MTSLRQRTLDALELRGMAVRARARPTFRRPRSLSREELARLFAAARHLKSRTFLTFG